MQDDNNNSKFKTKRGFCTRYALACGYIDLYHDRLGRTITLWEEGKLLNVRALGLTKRLFWETYEHNELQKARKKFMETKKLFQQALKNNITED